ncbi:hypothetical protein D3C80_1444500 [compost metagenome]
MGHAHAIFTGHGQDQLFFPTTQLNIHRNTTFTGGFQQRLLPVMVEVTVKRSIRAGFVQIRRHFVRPDAILILTRFLDGIGAETDDFAFDHHVQPVTVSQRFGHFYVQIIFRYF